MEDEQIIKLYLSRSESAITETSSKYGTFFRRISLNILRSDPDADECVNDAYLKTWNSIPPHQPERLPAFIARIVRNLSLNRWKQLHAQKRGSGELPLALSELEECVPDRSTVESEYDRSVLSKALNRFLAGLPEEKRRVFMLRYWYLVPLKAIAEQTGKTESAVKSMLFRTRSELRSFLEKEDIQI